MGEALDFGVGERVDLLTTILIAPAPGMAAGGDTFEALFHGEVKYVWNDAIDVKAGEQVFRVPRTAVFQDGTDRDPWRFRPSDAVEFYEAEYYDPEDHIDYEQEGEDA